MHSLTNCKSTYIIIQDPSYMPNNCEALNESLHFIWKCTWCYCNKSGRSIFPAKLYQYLCQPFNVFISGSFITALALSLPFSCPSHPWQCWRGVVAVQPCPRKGSSIHIGIRIVLLSIEKPIERHIKCLRPTFNLILLRYVEQTHTGTVWLAHGCCCRCCEGKGWSGYKLKPWTVW